MYPPRQLPIKAAVSTTPLCVCRASRASLTLKDALWGGVAMPSGHWDEQAGLRAGGPRASGVEVHLATRHKSCLTPHTQHGEAQLRSRC